MYTKPLERQHHLEAGLVCSPNSSKCVPLSHFSYFSIHLVQGIPQLHESLLRFREVSKEKKNRTKQKPWIKSSHRRGNKHMNMSLLSNNISILLGISVIFTIYWLLLFEETDRSKKILGCTTNKGDCKTFERFDSPNWVSSKSIEILKLFLKI